MVRSGSVRFGLVRSTTLLYYFPNCEATIVSFFFSFSMLGLGDIIIPGIIALLQQFSILRTHGRAGTQDINTKFSLPHKQALLWPSYFVTM